MSFYEKNDLLRFSLFLVLSLVWISQLRSSNVDESQHVLLDTVYTLDTIPPPLLTWNERVELINHTKYPSFSKVDVKGKLISSDQYRDSIVFINYWFKDCGGCIIEIPQLNQLREAYKDKVVFLGMTPDSTQTVLDFLNTMKFDFIIIPEANDIVEAFGLVNYPLSIFINRKGIVKHIKWGLPVSPPDSGKKEILVFEKYSELLDEMILE